MSGAFEWTDGGPDFEAYSLTLVKGMSHEELAVRLGAQPDAVMAPDTAHEMFRLSHEARSGALPDWAVLGETGNGWAFAIESPEARDRADRYASGRDLYTGHTVVNIWDSTMDPPIITVSVDGVHDWMMWEYTADQPTHPLTRRLAAEHGDGEGDGMSMENVYRALGEHYGLMLSRKTVVDRQLPHVFTEPRRLVRPRGAVCPACGENRMIVHGGGSWQPGEYRLVCTYYKVPDMPGYPPQGCPGQISGPALADVVSDEPNLKYGNVRMPVRPE
ncbi:hypothetical protein [Streptomyces sp. MMG1121]|uniref:hypothetical protein n=1 Tax=Streptomyces sp. MMG1121 TaxID=1415544 RepID=UPI0006AF69F6|nr:hypothetical protein [Streptomyces sp. MMG1121]KOV67472.1 hypothetical protein ADK64_08820 [Streptomyces sp. MMG1121]